MIEAVGGARVLHCPNESFSVKRPTHIPGTILLRFSSNFEKTMVGLSCILKDQTKFTSHLEANKRRDSITLSSPSILKSFHLSTFQSWTRHHSTKYFHIEIKDLIQLFSLIHIRRRPFSWIRILPTTVLSLCHFTSQMFNRLLNRVCSALALQSFFRSLASSFLEVALRRNNTLTNSDNLLVFRSLVSP